MPSFAQVDVDGFVVSDHLAVLIDKPDCTPGESRVNESPLACSFIANKPRCDLVGVIRLLAVGFSEDLGNPDAVLLITAMKHHEVLPDPFTYSGYWIVLICHEPTFPWYCKFQDEGIPWVSFDGSVNDICWVSWSYVFGWHDGFCLLCLRG